VLRTPTLVFSAVWLVLYGVIVAQLPSPDPLLLAPRSPTSSTTAA
jgi:hypothetical protein